MKTVLGSANYSFDKTAKTIDFTNFAGFDKSKLYAVINVTANQTLIYAVASYAAGIGGSFSGSVLTLNYDTSSMNNGDALQVIYDDPDFVQKISASSLPLPSGASTSAKQPALGTAGSASSDVITVQGIASMVALKVDGSAVTQPVSASSLPLPSNAAQETGGNLATIASNTSGIATSAQQTSGAQKTQITDSNGTAVTTKTLSTNLASADVGLVTNTIIHGESTASAGTYIDVKVTPSGAIAAEVTLAGLDSAVIGQETMSNSLPVTIASDQTAIPISDNSGSITVDGTITANAGTGNFTVVQSTASNLKAQVSGQVDASQFGQWDIANISGTISLPTGAATETTLSGMSGKLPSSLGQKTMANSMAVVVSSDQSAIKINQTNSKGEFIRNDYTSTSVTTSAYTQLIASTAATYSAIEIFDSSGQTLKMAIGGAGSEVDQFLIFQGGNGRIPFSIASGSRISIRAVSGTANLGEICINFYV